MRTVSAGEHSFPEVQPDEFAEFAVEVAAWLGEHAPVMRNRCRVAATDEELFAANRDWQRELFDAGWAGLSWPTRFGGRGETAEHAAIFAREQQRFDVSAGFVASTIGMVGPVLMQYGSAAQQERYLRRLLRGDETWCQLFSEPIAGSDLANLATRAQRDGDSFVVNGQKVWTSSAHLCDFAILLARTNPDRPKHHGISFLLLDLRTPGVEIRPLRQITGECHFNEVFLTDVRIPVENVVGPVDEGWRVARAVLSHEAAVIGGGNATGTGCTHLIALARAKGVAADPVVRQRLATAYTGERILDFLRRRARSASGTGTRPEVDGSVMKVLWSQARRARAELGVALLGAGGALHDEWPTQLLEQFSSTIGGGTNEVHRTMIGERVLGLPPELRVDRELSYRELTTREGADRRG